MDPVPYRIGSGHDLHRLEPGRTLVVGGVPIPHETGPAAHSDGDVLLHAVTDALLGSLALGDIGEWFPDTDPAWQGTDSARFVTAAVDEIVRRGWTVGNLDCTVFAQRPKLSPHKPRIRQRLAELLRIEADRVNVKAKTGERVGPIGREEAIAAEAVVLVVRAGPSPSGPRP
jgi:2-C-methyl-D-erythritol 2,4-cyclodiphosphate synthase